MMVNKQDGLCKQLKDAIKDEDNASSLYLHIASMLKSDEDSILVRSIASQERAHKKMLKKLHDSLAECIAGKL